MIKKYDLSWGDTACVRQAFTSVYDGQELVFDRQKMNKMGYTPHYGDEKLLQHTKEIIERQIGKKYKHIILTNGATGAITITLRAYAQKGFDTVVTNKPPFFPLYPKIFQAAGLKHDILSDTVENRHDVVCLIDSPSNPLGLIAQGIHKVPYISTPVVLDAVYSNNVYSPGIVDVLMHHDVMVGSYSKLLGLNGIRVGWIATDDSLLYERLKALVDGEYAGLSGPSMDLLLQVLGCFSWDMFEKEAQKLLNYNREEWAKLERFFDGLQVNSIGMFFYGKMDTSVKKLMEKSGIEWLSGSVCHDNDAYGRFNLGQDCTILKEAVKSILKNDKR